MSKELCDIDLKDLIEQETGNKFNRDGSIQCPFHNDKTPSLSVKFFPDNNKEKFKCFACGESGDAIDFIQKYKSMKFKEARAYLGMENKKTQRELDKDKVISRIEWDIKNQDKKKDFKLLGLWEFVNEDNKVIYYKAKFLKPDNKKSSAYYHFENGKVVSGRGSEEVPYNLYNVIKAIQEGKVIIPVEGEKDADMVNYILKNEGYVATSFKGCKDLSVLKIDGIKMYVIGDTGEAGERYKWHIYKEFRRYASVFKFINLPYLKALGDNKDVTDWLEYGHTKKELLLAFKRSLDLCSKHELQQDQDGIYKTYFKGKDEEREEKKYYITDFQILEAKRLQCIDDEYEGIKLKLKSFTGHIFEKVGPSTVFSDVKSFKKFLGTLDLTFKSKIEDLTLLGSWINRFFAIENEEIYQGVKFMEREDGLILITNDGALTKDNVNFAIKADNRNKISLVDTEEITKDELIKVTNHILRFATPDKSIPIVGTTINNLAVFQNKEIKSRLHHLLIVGESGSGKSTILKNVVAAILNYPSQDIKSIGLVTPFAFVKDLSDGNYPTLYDEFKPSMMDHYKMLKLSDSLRNLYDRTTISRGSRSFDVKEFQLSRPVIIAGEESYPNAEKALIDRSAIVYLSRRERQKSHTEAMKWIINNERLINKFGKSLIKVILGMTSEEYREIQSKCINKFENLHDRPLTTAVNISCGIEIFNKLLKSKGIEYQISNYTDHIRKNIDEEILDGGTEVKSTVEQMISLYNDMIEDGRTFNEDKFVLDEPDGVYIKTSEMINQIHDFCNRIGSAEITLLKLRDFKKQAQKAGYITGTKQKRIDGKNCRCDIYDKEMLRNLKVYSMVKPEFDEVKKADKKVVDMFSDSKAK